MFIFVLHILRIVLAEALPILDDLTTLFLLQQAAILGKITEVFIVLQGCGQLIEGFLIMVLEISCTLSKTSLGVH